MAWMKPVRGLLAGFSMLLLTACLDVEHEVAIKGDGSGEIRLALITDPILGEDAEFEKFFEDEDQESTVREYTEDGKFIHEETIRFDNLAELTLKDDEMRVLAGDPWLFGFGPTTATFERTLSLEEKTGDDLRLLERIFLDNTYTFSVTLPGWVTSAKSVTVFGEEIEPIRAGNTTTWEIPLTLLSQSGSVTFEIDFMGYFDFEGEAQNNVIQGGLGDMMGLLPRD